MQCWLQDCPRKANNLVRTFGCQLCLTVLLRHLFHQAGGQEAAVIMGQTEVMLVAQFLGLGIQDLVVCLTHKETVSYQFE